MNAIDAGLRIHFVDHAFNLPSWRWDSRVNRWPGHLLWLVVGGSGRIALRGQATHDVGPGDCFLFDMRRVHHGRNDPDRPLEIRAVGFVATDAAGQELRHVWPNQRRHRRLANRVAVAVGMERILREHRAGHASQAVGLLRDILTTIRVSDEEPLPTGPERVMRERILEIAEAMADDPSIRWTVAALARRAGIGREHFTRVFTRVLGLSPGRYLIQVRMDHAQALLRGSPAGIAAVAARIGYEDPAYFSRQFTAVVGRSPRAYRRSITGLDAGNIVTG